jgi:hypothetical protein
MPETPNCVIISSQGPKIFIMCGKIHKFNKTLIYPFWCKWNQKTCETGNESKLYKTTHQAYTQFASVSSVAVLLWVATCEYIRGNFILGAGGAQKAANVYKFWCSEMRTETNSNRWRTHYSNSLYIVSASGQDVYTYLIRVAGAQERASPDAA